MEILPSLLGFISSRVKVLKSNISDLVNDTGNALEKTAENTARTINDTLADPMAMAGTGTMLGKGAKLFNFQKEATAFKMKDAGFPTEEIRRRTDTWLGHPDKNPRQEIPDNKD